MAVFNDITKNWSQKLTHPHLFIVRLVQQGTVISAAAELLFNSHNRLPPLTRYHESLLCRYLDTRILC